MRDKMVINDVEFWATELLMNEFGVADTTITRWRRRGLLTGGINLGRHWYYPIVTARERVFAGEAEPT